jgi:hypothetical protein
MPAAAFQTAGCTLAFLWSGELRAPKRGAKAPRGINPAPQERLPRSSAWLLAGPACVGRVPTRHAESARHAGHPTSQILILSTPATVPTGDNLTYTGTALCANHCTVTLNVAESMD